MNILNTILDNVQNIKSLPKVKGFYVYKGLDRNTKNLVYIGTTTQIPANRFRWHKSKEKDLNFEIVKVCKNETDMLQLKFDLIESIKPKLNKITKQNFNKALSLDELELRKGDIEWCQSCLKRRVNAGYTKCYYC